MSFVIYAFFAVFTLVSFAFSAASSSHSSTSDVHPYISMTYKNLEKIAKKEVDAQLVLGSRYAADGENKKAVKWFKKAAQNGCIPAQYNLGLMYLTGRGVKQSEHEASQWFEMAALAGDADSQCEMGLLFARVSGVKDSEAMAARWFLKAAEQGHRVAQFNLARLYVRGAGVPKSMKIALKLFTLAAAQGDDDAKVICQVMNEQLVSQGVDPVKFLALS